MTTATLPEPGLKTPAPTSSADAFNLIRERAEEMRNDEEQTFPVAASPNDAIRQGDVYVIYRAELPEGCILDPKPRRKVAAGDTQGAQHLLDSLEGVTIYTRKNPNALQGPLLVLNQTRVLQHPEHGNWVLPPLPGCYEVTYQRTMAEELKRVAD